MVKRLTSRNHNASHNATAMVPLQLVSPMIAACRFEHHEYEEDLLIRQVRAKAEPRDKQIDPFTLRERFWKVQDDRAMLQFLNDTGIPWGTEESFFMDDVFKFQEFTRQAVTKPVSSWQNLPLGEVPKDKVRAGGVWYADAIASLSPILCEESGDGFVLCVHYANLKQAILATVVIDKITRSTYRRCKMRGCGIPFKVGLRQGKQFCSEAHRQALAQKRYRRRKKSAKGGK